MQLPIHPHLLVLRSAATLVLALLIGQAGWAAAGLGRDRGFFGLHETFAWVTLAGCLVSLVAYLVLRRSASTVLVVLAALTTAMVALQVVLGQAGIIDAHVFIGVLTVMVGTALTSWTYRHRLPEQSSSLR